jgi:hypothetical protein
VRHSPGDEALRALAATQDGLVTRAQALDELSPAQVRTRLATTWQRLHPRAYLLGDAPPTPRQRLRAALLHVGAAAVLGGPTACRQHGLLEAPDDGLIHLLLPHGQRLEAERLAIVRTPQALRVVDRDGLPTVDVARAVADTCRGMSALQSVRALACEAVQRRFTTVERLAEELDGGPRAGSALLRRVVEELRAGVLSAPEAEVRDDLRRCRQLPPAEYNVPLTEGTRFLACVDVLFREACLVLEVNSRRWHGEADAFDATMERQARLTAAGYTVLPVTPAAWRADPQAGVQRVLAAYRALTNRRAA